MVMVMMMMQCKGALCLFVTLFVCALCLRPDTNRPSN